MIKRKIEKALAKYLNVFPAVGIIGPRQVGKTTIAKQIKKSFGKSSVYLDLENPRDVQLLKDPQLFLETQFNKLVIIDEVQTIPDLFPLLRSLIDMKRVSARFLLLGSANPLLINYTSESLAGRISYIELTPFNLMELPKSTKITTHWLRGGFPGSFLAADNDVNFKWLNNFIETYLNRDFRFLGLDVLPATLRRLWIMIAGVQGSILNKNLLSRSMGLSNNTISKYLDFLEGSFIVNRLQPFYINIKKRLVKSPKIYIRDSGILHRLLNISSFDQLLGNILSGSSWEGYAIEQIYQLAKDNFGMYYYRTQTGVEVDLVLARGLAPVATVEIKFSVAPTLSKGNYIAIDDIGAKQNFVIGFDVDDYPIRKDIQVCSLDRFLKHYLPKI